MADTTVLMKKPMELLRQDHERVRELFARYGRAGRADTSLKRNLLLDIDQALSTHSRIEETLFYPAMRNVEAERVGKALEGHRACKRLLDELMESDAGDPTIDAQLQELGKRVERHSRMEEAELYPLAARLPRKAQQELSVGIAACRENNARKDRPPEIPYFPPLGPADDAPPTSPDAPKEDKARGYENWGSE